MLGGSPVPAVHLESGWPDAQRLITGRLLALFERITMPIGDCSPLPATVSRVMASCPGSLLATCSDLCTSLEIVTPSSFGVGLGCSVQQVRAWFTQCVALPLDRALRDRLLVVTAAFTVHHMDPTTFTVNRGADPVVYRWSSSPSNARFWRLSRWGHDPFAGGRSARSTFGMRPIMCSVRCSHRRLVSLPHSAPCLHRFTDALVLQPWV